MTGGIYRRASSKYVGMIIISGGYKTFI